MTPYDFVYTLVLGGILEESLYDEQVTLLHVIIAITLWGTLIYSLETISTKNDKINRLIKGEPSVVIYHGKLVLPALKKTN